MVTAHPIAQITASAGGPDDAEPPESRSEHERLGGTDNQTADGALGDECGQAGAEIDGGGADTQAHHESEGSGRVVSASTVAQVGYWFDTQFPFIGKIAAYSVQPSWRY